MQSVAGYTRPLTLEDIPRVLELEQVFDNSMTEPMLELELQVGYGYAFCRDADSHVLGYALLRRDGDLLDLTRLAVDPEAQGGGAGTFLLLRVQVDSGLAKRDLVLCVRKKNPRALKLYQRHGFRIVGHSTSSDAWVLRRAWQREICPSDAPGA